MIFEVRLRPEAEQDLAEAAAWYEEHKGGLGSDFLDEVLSTLTSVAETPQMFPDVHRNTRRALIHRFPFGLYYRVEEATIIVIAVMHGSRDPRHWKKRT